MAAEKSLVNGVHTSGTTAEEEKNEHLRYTHKQFKWSPRFTDVYDSVEKAGPGNDGWAVKEGFIRYVTCMLLPSHSC